MNLRTTLLLTCLLAASAAEAEIRIYDVDSLYRQEVQNALDRVLRREYPDKPFYGTVEMLPTGQLLIEAPAAGHVQIETILAAIRARTQASPTKMMLRYWVLSGVPGRPDNTSGNMRMLVPVLSELEDIHGELGFEIIDTVTLMSQSGGDAEMDSEHLEIFQRAYSDGQIMNAEIELQFERDSIDYQVRAEFSISAGEFVVLGESSADIDETRGMVFYLVHWAGP
jgi:hypothetical protein